jgi:endonuclease/exonuclease/phosphatase family metal-dependent hydrolase
MTGILRCLTLNLWGAEPPLEGRMAVIAEGLRALAPEVVALQEVLDVPGLVSNTAEGLARATGYNWLFAPATAFRGGYEGLAILSRLPITAHETRELPQATALERRILLSACLEIGGGRSLWVHDTHLNYRLQHGREREDQVMAIDAAVAAHVESVPQILMGDFNARPESDEIRWLCGLVTLQGRRTLYQDAWGLRRPNEPGWTWASANPNTAALAFLQPDRRLDYIFVTPERRDGRGRVHGCRLVFDQPSADGIFASDHFGVLAEVQIDPDPPGPSAESSAAGAPAQTP